jgi:hypothetical protein
MMSLFRERLTPAMIERINEKVEES